jgi:hypothetical protein
LAMKALREAGYRIDSQDLVMDKRKVRR